MRVLSQARLKQFWELPGREDAEGPLRAWSTHVNIGGNKYRLIARNRYATQKVFVLKVMTHGEYDEDKWKGECGCFDPPPPPKQETTARA